MDRRQFEPITSPGLAVLAAATALLIVLNPDRATLWIVPAPIIAAIGCLLGARLAFNFRPRATGSATIFIAQAAFWLATAIFFAIPWQG